MSRAEGAATGAAVAAACVACCAPPVLGALGVVAGTAALAGLFLGVAAAVAVLVAGGTWVTARRARARRRSSPDQPVGPVPVGLRPPSSAPTIER